MSQIFVLWVYQDPYKRPNVVELFKHPWILSDKKKLNHLLTNAQDKLRRHQARKRLKNGIMRVLFLERMKKVF